ncbi:MAG: chromate transporter [Spirochaetaceae bacterium]|nr:chromate transporter [Spirochaetaceae bacterium]
MEEINEEEKQPQKKLLPTLLELFFAFFRTGIFTFGGGLAMMPMLQKELIEKKHWLTEEDLIDYYAIGQSTPGIIAVNVATFVGYRQAGILGAIVATLGIISPSIIIITILAGTINSISEYPRVQAALKGINVAVAALLTTVIIKFAKKTIKNVWNVLYMLADFVCIFFFKVPSFIIIIVAITLGCLNVVRLNKKEEKK